MKQTLKLATLILACCLAAVAQAGSYPNQSTSKLIRRTRQAWQPIPK